MKLETAEILSRFVDKENSSVPGFEQWVYSNPGLESDLGPGVYSELIALDFSDKSIRVNVKRIVDPILAYADLHKLQLLSLIDGLVSKSIAPLKGIRDLNVWANKGYLFLGSIELVGNFGEQGKSIVHLIDESMNDNTQWNKTIEADPNFLDELASIKDKIESGRIVLTGEKEELKYYGEQFKYEEK